MSRPRRVGWVAALVLITGCAAEQQRENSADINGSFEKVSPRGYPVGWYIEADPESAQVGVSRRFVQQGDSALRVELSGGSPVVLYTPLTEGRCLDWVKASALAHVDSADLEVSLFFLEPGAAPQLGETLPVTDAGWAPLEVEWSSDPDCQRQSLMLGIMVTGQGTAWIDKLNVESPLGGIGAADRDRPGFKEADLRALRRSALNLSAPAGELTRAERKAVGALFSGARIVGLGENSHGARALFELKHELLRVLVEDLDYRALALEMPSEPAEAVNEYVLGVSDDADRALQALSYPAWQSEEMWAIIEWLRARNAKAAVPVTFHGLDGSRASGSSVDEGMADRVAQILALPVPGRRLIVWADNTHVSQAGVAMGALLSRRFGTAYLALGFTFDEGHYAAYGPAIRYPVDTGYPGTHEHLMAALGQDSFLVRLDDLPDGHPLLARRGFRYIGSQPQPFHQFYPHRLSMHFDVVGFVRATDSIRYLFEHEF